jgi:hypothetical protein
MNIRFVRKGHQSKTILGEMCDAFSSDLPIDHSYDLTIDRTLCSVPSKTILSLTSGKSLENDSCLAF